MDGSSRRQAEAAGAAFVADVPLDAVVEPLDVDVEEVDEVEDVDDVVDDELDDFDPDDDERASFR